MKCNSGNPGRFYTLMSEGLHRRMIFQKLTQIIDLLEDEIKINKDLLISLVNNQIITLKDLVNNTNNQEKYRTITYTVICQVNHPTKLKNFVNILQNRSIDKHLTELMEEILFQIEMYQSVKIEDRIMEDYASGLCQLY